PGRLMRSSLRITSPLLHIRSSTALQMRQLIPVAAATSWGNAGPWMSTRRICSRCDIFIAISPCTRELDGWRRNFYGGYLTLHQPSAFHVIEQPFDFVGADVTSNRTVFDDADQIVRDPFITIHVVAPRKSGTRRTRCRDWIKWEP